MKDSTKKIINYLREVNGKKNVTAADVAAALGMTEREVNGSFTMAISNKHLGHREPGGTKIAADGTTKDAKFLVLDEAGLNMDLDEK